MPNKKLLLEFVNRFSSEEFLVTDDLVEMNKGFYLIGESLRHAIKEIKDYSRTDPYAAGIFLGEVKDKMFRPSLALLAIISKHSDRKVFADDEGEKYFLYGKDLFGKSVAKADTQPGIVLVQNKDDENLGYGRLLYKPDQSNSNKVILKNLLDRGDFIRRDKN